MRQLPAAEIIKLLGLKPHPEGIYYAQTHRSQGRIPRQALPSGFDGDRSYSTAIYCLITQDTVSRLHRIRSDELWHLYLGGPLRIVELEESSGTVRKTILGQDLPAGQKPQHAVPAGAWMGAYLDPGVEYALVGCTVAPGFDFADFELAEREALLKAFPDARMEISKLT